MVNTAADVSDPTDGKTSLREAIASANAFPGHTITFDPTVFASAQTITLVATLMLADTASPVTIDGPGADVLTVSGNNTSGVFNIASDTVVTMSGLTIIDGNGTYGGGVYNGGTLTITNTTFIGNSAAFGGAIYSRAGGDALNGVLTLSGDTFSDNSATAESGAIDNWAGGVLTVTDDIFMGNSAPYGGAIGNEWGSVAVTNSTFSDNTASTAGGAIINYNPGDGFSNSLSVVGSTISGNTAVNGGGIANGAPDTLSLTNDTITGNSVTGSGGGLFDYGTTTLADCTVSGNSAANGGGLSDSGTNSEILANTIVAGNTATLSGPDAYGTFISDGNNLIGETDESSGWIGSDLTGSMAQPLDPMLAPLAYYGGPTETIALLSGSPAIGAGNHALIPAGVITDQRGFALKTPPDIGAFQTQARLVANTTIDGASSPLGDLSLRQAVNLANVLGSAQKITFDPTVFATPQTITLTQGQLELGNTSGVQTITGPAAGVTISGGGLSRVFQVDSGVNATLRGLTISGGSTTGNGGGVDDSGSVTLIDCTLSGNSAANGGGLETEPGGTAALISSTISDNTTSGSGGGVGNQGATTLTNCTVAANSAANGAGLYNAGGSTALYDCTISGNTASGSGGGLDNASGTVTLGNTIVAGNTAAIDGPDAFGIFASLGHNLIGATDGSSGWVGSDLTGSTAQPLDPLLAPLGWYGGPTETMAFFEGSPAIDAGSNALVPGGVATDQRGFARVFNGAVDIGAFEYITQAGPLVVNSTADGGSPSGTLDLRGAVDLANLQAGAQAITFDPTVFAAAETITLGFGPLELSNTTGLETITGPAAGVTVSGGDLSRVFMVASAVTAAISGLAITGGSTTGDGGALYNEGSTTLTGVTVAGNSAAGPGGGVCNARRGTITIINCSITGNSSTAGGGGLYNDTGTVTLTDSTISGNTAFGNGGAVCGAKRGTVTIINCSISGNTAGAGGGLYNAGTANLSACTIAGNSAAVGGGLDNAAGGTATLEDAIVAANMGTGGSPSDIGGENADSVVGTYDLVGTGGSGGIAGGTGDIVLTNLNNLGLAPLGNYGGPTQTMPLLPGSAAIGTGTAIPGVSNDQRGLSPSAAIPDIGAFQSQGFVLTVVPGSTPQGTPTGGSFANSLAVTVTAIDPTEPVAGGVVSFTVNTASNGASASLSAATAVVGSDGIADVSATANSIPGSYTVTASAIGSTTPATFKLTNLIALTFSGIVSQSISPGTAMATFSGTLTSSGQTPHGENVAVTLDGVTQEAVIDPSGDFFTTFNTAGLAKSLTPYSVSYVYKSDGTFANARTTSVLAVSTSKATPGIAWLNPAGLTYGTALSAAQLDASASVPGIFTYNPAPGTVLDAGARQSLWVTFTPTDTTAYNTSSASVTINVARATPVITWANPAEIFSGTPLSATQLDATSSWTVDGVKEPVAGSFTYTPAAGTILNAGTGQILSVDFETVRLDRLQRSRGHGNDHGSGPRRPCDHPVRGRTSDGPDRRQPDLHDCRHKPRSVPGHGSHCHQPDRRWSQLCHRFGHGRSFGNRQPPGDERCRQPGHAGLGRVGHGDVHRDSQPDRTAEQLGQRDSERGRSESGQQFSRRADHRGRPGGNHRVQFGQLRRAGKCRLGHDHREPSEWCSGNRDGRLPDRPDQCDTRPRLYSGHGIVDFSQWCHVPDDRGPGSERPLRQPR